MKIAFDHQIFNHQMYGGISRYFVRLAKELLVKEEDIKIFSGFHRNKHLESLPKIIVQGKNINYYPPKTNRLALYLNTLQTKRVIKKWQPHIVHETYFAAKSSAPHGTPVIITIHDMIHELFPDGFKPQDRSKQFKKMAIDRSDHIICVSECTKKDLIRIYDLPEDKITTVYHGVDKVANLPVEQHINKEHRPFILYVGHRSLYKNFNRFIEAVALSKRIRSDFNVIAFGGGDFSKNELLLLNAHGFDQGQVKQMNGNDDVLKQLYSSAACFVYPSLYEGFGLPPLEAMSHNCPVISSNTSSMAEILDNAVEYFNPNSSEDMALAIANVLYSSTRTAELKRLGTERLESFSWEKCAAKTLGVYQKVLNEI